MTLLKEGTTSFPSLYFSSVWKLTETQLNWFKHKIIWFWYLLLCNMFYNQECKPANTTFKKKTSLSFFFFIVFHLPMLGSWSPGRHSNVNITNGGNPSEGEEDERLIEAPKSVSSSLTAEPWKILCYRLLASCLQDLGGYCPWPASWSGHRQFDQSGGLSWVT